MPSSHAQFVTFFSVSLSLFVILRHIPPARALNAANKRTNYTQSDHYHKPLTFVQKVGLSLLTVVLATSISLSRIYLDYHTPTQVLVGCGAGAVSAVGWFVVTSLLRIEGWVEWAVNSWAGRAGRWRDLAVEEDLAEAGWQKWRERIRKRSGDGVARDEEDEKKVR